MTYVSAVKTAPVRGHVEPRLFTPPLRRLTRKTSFGFDVVEFASEVLHIDLDPWQQKLAVRIGELLPDGRPRFRKVLVLVARQNGKTRLGLVFVLYWMAIDQAPLVLATSTSRSHARATWLETIDVAEKVPALRTHVRKTIGEEALTIDGSQYKFAASTHKAGRSFTVHRALVDELREHRSFDAWGAVNNATQAVPDAQVLCLTNQGDSESVVLDSLRQPGIDYINTGVGDERLGLFEWSAPSGCDPADPEMLAMANPDLGNRILVDSLVGDAERAKTAGGLELATFRTEVLCQRVGHLDAAIDIDAWTASGSDTPEDLSVRRERLAACIDISMDGSHATLAVAVELDDQVHVEIAGAWSGHGCVALMKQELPALLDKVNPNLLGWFPNGPAASIAVDMRRKWPVKTVEIKADMTSVCMGLSQSVTDHRIRHNNDPLLHRHVENAEKLRRGDAWVFGRHGQEAIDAAYATAGAVHLARTLPPPLPQLAVL